MLVQVVAAVFDLMETYARRWTAGTAGVPLFGFPHGVGLDLPSARLLAATAQGGLLVLCVAMALEHLGVGRQVILTAFTIAFGGLVLALALAFGLAGRDLARELLERLARRPEPSGEDQRRHT